MSDITCNICGENKDENYGVSFGAIDDFECNDCHVGDCGVCEKPVKGGEKSPDVLDCTHCANWMHKACVKTDSEGDRVCNSCL